MTKTIFIRAAPSARMACPPDYIEGVVMQVPANLREIEFAASGSLVQRGLLADQVVEHEPLAARPIGRFYRDPDSLESFPIWEVRSVNEWRNA